MSKIRIVQQCDQLGLGGAEKVLKLYCQYLNKEEFDVHVLAPRYPVALQKKIWNSIRAFFGDKKAKSFLQQQKLYHVRLPELISILGQEKIHLYTKFSAAKILKSIAPHILHIHHSGTLTPPWNDWGVYGSIPVVFTVSAFGFQDHSPCEKKLDKILFSAYWVKDYFALWSKGDERCDVLYPPIERPKTSENLRKELGIGADIFVLGRNGRNADDIHDPISLRAYQRIENDKTLFLAVSAPPAMKKQAEEMKIKNIHFLEPTTDSVYLSRFYNTMDVLAHARPDGETFGNVIAEAMMHGKPAVTHRTDNRNAQAELVTPECGFVVDQNDDAAYAECLERLMKDSQLRAQMGIAAKKKAMETFEVSLTIRKLERMYKEELAKKQTKTVNNNQAPNYKK